MIKLKYKCEICSTSADEAEYFNISIYDKPAFKVKCKKCGNTDIFIIKKKHKDELEVNKFITKKDIVNYYENDLNKQIQECNAALYKEKMQDKYNKYLLALKEI